MKSRRDITYSVGFGANVKSCGLKARAPYSVGAQFPILRESVEREKIL